MLRAQSEGLIEDFTIAGVSGGRTSEERVPRAWIVLSKAGKKEGTAATVKALEEWSQQNLTKWLRGGFARFRCATCILSHAPGACSDGLTKTRCLERYRCSCLTPTVYLFVITRFSTFDYVFNGRSKRSAPQQARERTCCNKHRQSFDQRQSAYLILRPSPSVKLT